MRFIPYLQILLDIRFFNKFHQGNRKKDSEQSRRIENVKELASSLNTQTCEQLNNSLKADVYFLDSMNPNHFLQLTRSMFAVRNDRKNNNIVCETMKTFNNSEVEVDNAGKLTVLSKTEHNKKIYTSSISNNTPTNDNRNFDISLDSVPTSPSDQSLNHAAHISNFRSQTVSSSSVSCKKVFSEYSKNNVWKTPLQASELLVWDSLFSGGVGDDISPPGTPFPFTREDMKSLTFDSNQYGKSVRGEIINACLLVFAGLALEFEIRVYVLPDHFLNSCRQDISQELLLPEDLKTYHVVVGAVQMHFHWYAYIIDSRTKSLYFLDSLGSTSSIRDEDRKGKLPILRYMIMARICRQIFDDATQHRIEEFGWKIVTSPTFFSDKGFHLPLQTSGNDCGVFVIMYCWNVILCESFPSG